MNYDQFLTFDFFWNRRQNRNPWLATMCFHQVTLILMVDCFSCTRDSKWKISKLSTLINYVNIQKNARVAAW